MAATSTSTKFKFPFCFMLLRRFSDSPATPLTMETVLPFVAHKCNPPSRSVTTFPSELLSFFRTMTAMRRIELAADSLYKAKLVRGFCHLYDGQEAIAVGMEAAITRRDAIITAYRDHCIYVARGGSPFEVFAELMGRRAGCSKGKGGSMHLYKKDASFYGGHGIVGAHIPLGCGIALGQKYSKEGTVTFVLYGDGAANQGQFYESLNMAALWNLPVVLVCENNHYGMGTAEWRASKNTAYYNRADYVPDLKVDGMDVLAVKQACKFAKEYVLQNGPIVNNALQEEIREINQQLIDTVISICDEDSDSVAAAFEGGGEGTMVKCSFNAVSFSPSLKAHFASMHMSPITPLRLLVPSSYPKCSPLLLDKLPIEPNKEFKDLSIKAKSRFSVSLRGLSQPMSLGEMAGTWDACARKVIVEYAQQTGGGSFSSTYGAWENCVGA